MIPVQTGSVFYFLFIFARFIKIRPKFLASKHSHLTDFRIYSFITPPFHKIPIQNEKKEIINLL